VTGDRKDTGALRKGDREGLIGGEGKKTFKEGKGRSLNKGRKKYLKQIQQGITRGRTRDWRRPKCCKAAMGLCEGGIENSI